MTSPSEPGMRLRIGWVGFHMEGVEALEALLRSGTRVEAVITLDQERLHKRSGHIDFETVVAEYGTPLFRVSDINSEASVALLKQLSLDVVFVIGWSQILKPETLATARIGMIGAHASLLPHNRGSAPINWALIRGQTCTGNSLIWLAAGVDEGAIIDQLAIPITMFDTAGTLYEKVARTNREMILRLLPRLRNGERPGRPQPSSAEPLLPRRKPSDGRIDWSMDARDVYNFVRALARPYPGAFSTLDGTVWKVWNCALLPAAVTAAGEPGTLLGPVYSPVADACGQLVRCGEGAVVLLEVEGPDGEILRGADLTEQNWAGKVWSNG